MQPDHPVHLVAVAWLLPALPALNHLKNLILKLDLEGSLAPRYLLDEREYSPLERAKEWESSRDILEMGGHSMMLGDRQQIITPPPPPPFNLIVWHVHDCMMLLEGG